MSAGRLSITRVFRAELERVFDAWVRPEVMARWLVCASDGVARAESDLRVGGTYRVAMSRGGEALGAAHGRYLEIVPPNRLVFTWSAEDVGVTDSVVTVELRSVAGGTEVSLIQDLAPDSDAGRRHARGWQTSLDNLQRVVEQR